MAKTRKATKRQEEKDWENIKESARSFVTSDRIVILTGLILSFIVIYVGLSMISFFFTGGTDQSAVENIPSDELMAARSNIKNWGGVFGARLSDFLINGCFGIPTFFMLFFVGSVGCRMMGIPHISLLKRFIYCTVGMLWCSLTLSFFIPMEMVDTFIYLGGRLGYFICDTLIKAIGDIGTILLILSVLLIMLMSMSSRVVSALKKTFGLTWLPASQPPDTPTDDPDDKENERGGGTEVNTPITNEDDDIGFDFIVPDGDESNHTQSSEPPSAGDLPKLIGEEEDDDRVSQRLLSELGPYDPKATLSHYRYPTIELLDVYDQKRTPEDVRREQEYNKNRIIQTLNNFDIRIKSIKATVGPTVTLYEIVIEDGIKISKIRGLEDDIAMSLSALGIRIIAPMPGKGTIGIEVPNSDPQIVSMRSTISSPKFQDTQYELPVALGRTITNEVYMVDLIKLPHLLVAGATGQGKSVGLNAAITSLLYKKHPGELKFVLIDPKMVEFSLYSVIERHFLAKLPDSDKPIITDFTKVIYTLNSLCKLMDDRYLLLEKAGSRNVQEYNEKFINRRLNPAKGHEFMPYIVVIIDEFGDLIMTAGKEIELPIARIAQKARAVGIHMIIATQRPTANIITGTIKANFPARIAFRVITAVDSRTILDSTGANQLIGRGDMLLLQGSEKTRIQCAFVDTPEVDRIAKYIGRQQGYPETFFLPEYTPEGSDDKLGSVDMANLDPMFESVARMFVNQQQASTSLIQRKFGVGFARAGRIMDQIEAAGIVGAQEGSKPRQVLILDEYSLDQKLNTILN